jgi:hypothetical protein
MSWPASQRRALNQIEKALAGDHPSLGPLFAIFTRLTGHEAMPVTEQVKARPWQWPRRRLRRPRPAVVAIVGLAMATGALLALSLTLPSSSACPSTVTPVAVYTRPVPTGRQAACAPQQTKPSQASQSRLSTH